MPNYDILFIFEEIVDNFRFDRILLKEESIKDEDLMIIGYLNDGQKVKGIAECSPGNCRLCVNTNYIGLEELMYCCFIVVFIDPNHVLLSNSELEQREVEFGIRGLKFVSLKLVLLDLFHLFQFILDVAG